MGLPCCCMSLQRGVSILAIIDAILNGIAIVLLGLSLAALIAINPGDHEDITKDDKTYAIVFVVLAIISCIFQMTLAIYLRRGAKAKDQRVCYVWLIIAAILLIFGVVNLGRQSFHASANISGISSGAVGIIYKLYEIWVVASFRNELLRTATNIQFAA